MKTQPDITGDVEAMTIIDHALSEIEQDIDLNKVIFKLNQEIDNYSLMHDFKLPSTLTKLKIMLDENPNKWTGAGLKGSIWKQKADNSRESELSAFCMGIFFKSVSLKTYRYQIRWNDTDNYEMLPKKWEFGKSFIYSWWFLSNSSWALKLRSNIS